SILSGTTFTILTDHKPLVSFKAQTDLRERQARWQAIIFQFDCTIKHIDGNKNYIADALSRIWLNPSAITSPSHFICQQVDPTQSSNKTITTARTKVYTKTPKRIKMSQYSEPISPLT